MIGRKSHHFSLTHKIVDFDLSILHILPHLFCGTLNFDLSLKHLCKRPTSNPLLHDIQIFAFQA
jgi:hypothetical protein